MQKNIIDLNKIQINQTDSNKVGQVKPLTYTLVESVMQREQSRAMAFNYEGSLFAAGVGKDVKIWKLNKGIFIEQDLLQGHAQDVFCIVFSKKVNWLASGSGDNTIKSWKEEQTKNWVSSELQLQHDNIVICLILNKTEDELISCSYDQSIKVWKVNCELNILCFGYTLQNTHQGAIYSISLNESESTLVSCGEDRLLILWKKGQNEKWEYQNNITTEDCGKRLCFISDNQIAWQQNSKGFTQIFEIESGYLKEKKDLKITLKEAFYDYWLFPTIFNKNKQVMIQKHNNYVYIIKKLGNCQFQIESEPINCLTDNNFGTLSEDGEYLVIWNSITKQFRVYNIIYK